MNSSISRTLSSTVALRPSSRSVVFQWPSKCAARSFSQSSLRAGMTAPKVVAPKPPAQMSMKNRLQETMRGVNKEMVPDDIGLLPGTFIRPVWQNLPSLFSDPKSRLHMEWMHWKMKFLNFMSLFTYCKFINKKLPLRLRERKKMAIELHKRMYDHFASGNLGALQSYCCNGIFESFFKRVVRRPANSPELIWKLHKYLKFPHSMTITGARVVSDRAAALPNATGMGIRQVIVRIQSRQSLITPPAPIARLSEKQIQDIEKQQKEKQKDCTEYIVLQRFMWGGKDGEWKVWGLADETTTEDLRTNPMFMKGITMKDRLEMMAAASR
ncbi:Mitochondrial inner membrane protein Mba1 [Trichophyton interdigitale]|uniref:Mitochondrial inner membrane protein Mba1 n=1 Tax=Trichophyton interdigitale TaxID=101480 RepID=A0A9P4YIQ1_9EURO|nr:Mitochondrial inner membrane protein Mba1 [Trichophyton interdigitale]KAF3896439.1 Mitochondrial inner membrane protein Mba1 [Trichophyton interdigitale]KAG8209312.1 Mitochondrial inner membrane protein Mba1 [Trichophyton interdigitale]